MIDYYTRVAPYVLPHLRGPPADAQALSQRRRRRSTSTRRTPEPPAGVGQTGDDPDPHATGARSTSARRRPADARVAGQPRRPRAAHLAGEGGRPQEPDDPRLRPRPGRRRPRSSSAPRWRCELREVFEHLGLQGFPKTSGSKGMQVYVPLNVAGTTYAQTKRFSQAIAQLLERRHPELVVSEMRKDLRPGKVFVDWSQNDEHKTTVASTRCGPGAADRLDPAALGGGRGGHGVARPGRARRSPPPTCSSGSPSTATCSRRSSELEQELPAL